MTHGHSYRTIRKKETLQVKSLHFGPKKKMTAGLLTKDLIQSFNEFSIELFADDLAALRDALNRERAHVLGRSMGNCMAQELALNCPDKVDKLILHAADCGDEEMVLPGPEVFDILNDIAGTPQEREESLLMTLFPQKWLEEHPDPRTYFAAMTETSSPENIERQYQGWENWNGTDSRLPQITQPTLLVTRTDDVLTPPQDSLIVAGGILGAWLVQLKDEGMVRCISVQKNSAELCLLFFETNYLLVWWPSADFHVRSFSLLSILGALRQTGKVQFLSRRIK